MSEGQPVLVEVRRGSIVEAQHRGRIVVVDSNGRRLAGIGDPLTITSTRSAIKLVQALPLLSSGAAARFGMTPREITLACASHSGEPIHTEAVARLLDRLGLSERELRCGAHEPYDEETARSLVLAGQGFSQLHNNCSGKHAGMLAYCVHAGLSRDDYTDASHPLQREISSLLARLAGLEEPLPTAVDGCGAPTFAIPLQALALVFARLADARGATGPTPVLSASETEAAKTIIESMIRHPEMVGGKGRLDTDLIGAAGGALVSKIGAEAVHAIAILPCQSFPRGAGIAIKIEDGSSRGLGPAVVETLVQLDLLDSARLSRYHRPKVLNRANVVVGEVAPVFKLDNE